MNGNKIVLDASAILALFNQELGYEQVEQTLPIACISSVNLAEVVSKLTEKGFNRTQIEFILARLNLDILNFDHEQALIAGSLRTETKNLGLSLGDRACLSLALVKQIPVLTADRVWLQLSLEIDIRTIR
ncbi:MAG: PIN domain-containing protein [Cyanobacteria bacterium]|nr:PIN domain-containing protein [Cyanobacteria bacterium GSL.Bin21]